LDPNILAMDMKIYQSFSHPSDLGLTIFGNSLEALFENAAFAMFDNLCNLDQVKESGKVTVTAQGGDREELLVNFLNELLYLQATKGWLFRTFEVQKLDNSTVKAFAWGEPYSANVHELFHEIKSATYHDIHIRRENGTWRVDVVFDV
jgi:SHS2 domain-containing protein